MLVGLFKSYFASKLDPEPQHLTSFEAMRVSLSWLAQVRPSAAVCGSCRRLHRSQE